jgi:hypothetical protein
MTRRHHHDDDEERLRIIRDGGSVRVPMFAMDGVDDVQRSIAAHLHDGHGGAVGHRPGHIVSGASDANDVRRKMYDAYDREKAAEYLGDRGEGAEGNAWHRAERAVPARAGRADDEELHDALPTRDSNTNMTLDALEAQHRSNMANVYAAYDARIREMWRNP